ncbi:helix-turn-helix domain-containing protein [Aureimonas ureilytica]|uniref:helix-turn-helix domain-containing protein n=1 Tax=Aureimonas ureilytica TaxID=401562 RepID=UPI0003608007|nr:helix-turn-helix transcriptional regulator [Aureimonas ureilytica]
MLSENVRRLRTTDGDTVETVARSTGLPIPLIQAIENGREEIAPRALQRLAQHFRVKPEDLLA